MRRLPLLALVAFGFSGCTPKPESTTTEPAHPQIIELDAVAAARSFTDKVESKLEALQIAQRASSALVRKGSGGTGEDIVYTFRSLGDVRSVAPLLLTLSEPWHPSNSQACWMPWESVTQVAGGLPGPFLGAFLEGSYADETFHPGAFKLTLWIDRHGNDLFICYTAPIPSGDPVENITPATGE